MQRDRMACHNNKYYYYYYYYYYNNNHFTALWILSGTTRVSWYIYEILHLKRHAIEQ